MASRPKGFGMTAELQRKKDAKYDSELEAQARAWMDAVLGGNDMAGGPDQNDFHAKLTDGVILCRLANALGGNIKFNQSKMAFKMMENIGKFLEFCDSIGVPKTDIFQTVDLYEKQNMPQVSTASYNIVMASSTGKTRHTLGPKEATANKREFTEEQLRDGQNVIGLQMGTNKGASQSGDHFGRPRQVAGANVYK
ncbi:Transgelin [Exaiptasia diaphana]|nr:Transgelin [Exaiptasia diaphana]